jgi:ubiquinone/menaquinone biosynthesis C-methylase UbiE
MKDNLEAISWDDYWNSNNINRDIMQVWAAYFVGLYEKTFGFDGSEVILDFGAGFGNVSFFIRNKASQLYLYDKSEYMQEVLRVNFQHSKNIQVVKSVDEIDEKLDLIIINSVIQYMSIDELKQSLLELQRLCKPETKVIISDVIPPNYSKLADFLVQLKLSIKFNFFSKLVIYAVSNSFFSPQLSLSSKHLTKYDEQKLIDLLEEHNFSAEKMQSNFTFSKKRYTLVCYHKSKKTEQVSSR